MTSTPRHFLLPCAALYLIFALAASPALAQTRTGDGRPTKPTASKNKVQKNKEQKEQAARKRDEESLRRRRRQQALTALREAADAARAFDEPEDVVEAQTLAADALWRYDEPTARIIFRRAWVAGSKFDKASQEESQRRGDPPLLAPNTYLREELLRTVAARDTRMAEAFLQELLDEKRRYDDARAAGKTSADGGRPSLSAWGENSAGGMRRLELSNFLLIDGDAARAAELIAPVIEEGVSKALIEALLNLRAQNAAQADALYFRLLQRTRAGGADETSANATDTNAVLLLSSYVATPEILMVVNRSSIETSVRARLVDESGADPSPLPAELRAAFYELAAAVLVRRPRITTDGGSSKDDLVAQFFAVERLLPFFEREAAPLAPALRVAREALANELEAKRRELLSSQSELRSLKSKNPTDPLAGTWLDHAEPDEHGVRDGNRAVLVLAAASRKLWERARNVASVIEDEDARRAAFTFIALYEIENLPDSFAENQLDDYERAATFVRGADVPPAARAWGLAQAATLAARRKQGARAAELLDDATGLAESVEMGTEARVAAFAALIEVAAQIDTARVWESLAALVHAANATDDGDGDGLKFDVTPKWASDAAQQDIEDIFRGGVGTFRIDEVFGKMVRLDAARTLDVARTLDGKVTRVFVNISTARAILEQFDERRDGEHKPRQSSVK